MEDKLIEVWRQQFESGFKTNSAYEFKRLDGEYCSFSVESAWQGFLMAKQSKPVVDASLWQVAELNDYDRGYNQAVKDMIIRIESAGIQFKVRGE